MGTIYVATEDGVGPEQTMDLLNQMSAIWCPPPNLRAWSGEPTGGEKCILVYRGQNWQILGSGQIRNNPREIFGTHVLWTQADVPGLRDCAIDLGYPGPNSMAFLILDNIKTRQLGLGSDHAEALDPLQNGVNVVDGKDPLYFDLFGAI